MSSPEAKVAGAWVPAVAFALALLFLELIGKAAVSGLPWPSHRRPDNQATPSYPEAVPKNVAKPLRAAEGPWMGCSSPLVLSGS